MNLFKNPEKYRKQILITSVVLVVIAAAVVLAGVAARFGNASVHLPDNVSYVNTDESIGVYTEDVSSVKTNTEASGVEIEVSSTTISDPVSDNSHSTSEPVFETPHGWVINQYGYTYVYGDAGYLQFNYKQTAFDRYVNAVNALDNILPEDIVLYNMIAPVSSTFADIPREVYTADNFYNLSQNSFENKVKAKLNADIIEIPVVSVIESLYRSGDPMFFRTDLNWTSQAAYAAYRQFCDAAGINAYAASNFPSKEYNGFLGSFYTATKSPDMFDDPDVLTCYFPLNAISAVLTVYDSETVFNEYRPGRETGGYAYDVFLGKCGCERYVIETEVSNGKRLLLIGDSSAYPLSLLLASHYTKVDIIDPVAYRGSLSELIEKEEYDEVLTVCYSTNAVSGDFIPSLNKLTGAVKNE